MWGEKLRKRGTDQQKLNELPHNLRKGGTDQSTVRLDLLL